MAERGKSPKTHNKIFKRIMLLCYLIAMVTVAIFAFTMITFEKRSIRGALDTRALALGSTVEGFIESNRDERDTRMLSDHCASIVGDGEHVDYIVLTNSKTGDALVHTLGVQRKSVLRGEWVQVPDEENSTQICQSLLHDGSRSYQYSKRIGLEGAPFDILHIGLSLDQYELALKSLYKLTGLAAAATLLVGTLLSWLFTRRFTEPILALQKHAHRIAGGGESSRVEINTNDEIEDLAESINAMVAALEQSKETIRDSLVHQQSLREKDILLREIHHRVKNNMQILSSMIRLQARRAESAELRGVLSESEARIRSMGLLHEKLYQSDSVSLIDIGAYLRSLTNELVRMNVRNCSKVEIKLAVHDVQMGIDTALPCGLIVTELVSNSMKYAFPANRAGAAILVSISKTNTGEYSLIVWDNGIGVPADFDISKSKSLGLRLVTMLCAQLNGEMHVSGQRGTRIEIRFKESEYAKRL